MGITAYRSWRSAFAHDAEWMSGKSRPRLAPVLTEASSWMSLPMRAPAQCLGESSRLVQGAGAQHGRHRLFGQSISHALRLRFSFTHAHMGQLRVDEQAIGNQAVSRCAIATIEVAKDNSKIILADVRED